MGQGYINSDFLTETQPASVKEIYDEYAGKLFGYVLTILHDRALAEYVVIKVFTNVFSKKKAISAGNFTANWHLLITLAQHEINITVAAKECKTVTENTTYINANRHLIKMNDIQRLVFCEVYYHRKTPADIARESGYSESKLRLALREAFMLIRGEKDED